MSDELTPVESNRKRKRVSRACDACHRSGTKCEVEKDSLPCRRCRAGQAICTYDRPLKKRGVSMQASTKRYYELVG